MSRALFSAHVMKHANVSTTFHMQYQIFVIVPTNIWIILADYRLHRSLQGLCQISSHCRVKKYISMWMVIVNPYCNRPCITFSGQKVQMRRRSLPQVISAQERPGGPYGCRSFRQEFWMWDLWQELQLWDRSTPPYQDRSWGPSDTMHLFWMWSAVQIPHQPSATQEKMLGPSCLLIALWCGIWIRLGSIALVDKFSNKTAMIFTTYLLFILLMRLVLLLQ